MAAAVIAWFFVLALVLFADAWRIARDDRAHRSGHRGAGWP
jgi:hypothetical protein